jgi:hypothetical protein
MEDLCSLYVVRKIAALKNKTRIAFSQNKKRVGELVVQLMEETEK